MATERESTAEELFSRGERFSKAFRNVYLASKNLGTDKGPARLNYHSMSGHDRIEKMVEVGAVREKIATKSIPFLDSKQDEIIAKLEPMVSAGLEERFRISEIRRYVDAGYLTEEDLVIARQEMDQFKQDLDRDYRRGLITDWEFVKEVFGRLTEQPAVQAESQVPQKPEQPVIPPVETPEVAAKQEKEKVIFIDVIDREKRIVRIGDRTIQIRGDLSWKTLMYLAERVKEKTDIKINTVELDQFATEAGSQANYPGSNIIGNLRKVLGDPNIILSDRHGRATADYIFNATVRFLDETPTKTPAEDKRPQALADIAEIQKRVDSGVLKDPEAIAKAQEYAAQIGGTIGTLQFRKLSVEDLAKLKKGEKFPLRETPLIVLSLILDDMEGKTKFTVPEAQEVMGKNRAGRVYLWNQISGSIWIATGVLKRIIAEGQATEEQINLWRRLESMFERTSEEKDRGFRDRMRLKINEWFRGKLSEQQIGEQSDSGAVAESAVQELGVYEPEQVVEPVVEEARPLIETPSKKLTERQRVRQALVTERVQKILQEFNPVTNFKDGMTGKRLTHFVKEVLGVSIRKTDMERAEKRGYITPAPADGHHVSYSQKDTITLVYLKRFGNNLNAIQRKKVIDIIEREYTTWKARKEAQSQNGNGQNGK